MRVVRWAVPLLVLLAFLAVAFLLLRTGKFVLPAPARPGSTLVAQAPQRPSLPHPATEVVARSRQLASLRPSLLALAAMMGWGVSLLLALLLLRLVSRWRTSFENKEWLLLPSDQARQMRGSLQALGDVTVGQLEKVTNCVVVTAEEVRAAAKAVEETRAEFSILRDELDSKGREVAALRMGQEFNVRRPLLMRVIRALDIIEDDLANRRDLSQTVEGVRVELRECLEDNSVSMHRPTAGTRLADAKGVDVQGAKPEPTADEALKGTIAATDRPGYVARGPQGAEEVLVPAKVRVFV